MEYHKYYFEQLYPLQDKFLNFFNQINNGRFYLTGGTALSRFYFQHRHSDDLDFFSREEERNFRSTVTAILNETKKLGVAVTVETITDNFLRVFLKENEISLKIDFVNETAFHWGEFNHFSLYYPVDNPTNILANKLTCISRYEVKDVVDIWILARKMVFSWRDIISIAEKKSPVDPLEVSKIITTLPSEELKLIKWTSNVDLNSIYSDLQVIAEDVFLGRMNSLGSP
jgi:predicted nucleotidyltransferase component of viral defense system